MNLHDLDSSDVVALKTNDPFMYYSIPEVHSAAMRHRSVDMSRFDASNVSPSEERRRDDGVVTRKSCISYEVHADLLMEDLLNEIESAPRPETDDSEDDFDFLSVLEKFQKL